ncbi:GNAT family N-acetyltransferase [Weissella tructae]|uniref:Acetyltransferase n=3 Tax=Weissella TaxID=46255 RepID=A0A075U639_9LACO|nr:MULTISPECIES: GNAT family protein [Weissella]AIG65602.1 Acetyltransferase [Weissella tructae]AIM62917.1 Acetyltransferase [Weissella ceti]AIM64315.1 Acetyltransferase [Weissella ceti]ELA06941.1 acetyltransferase [Weissella ceti NC36]QVV90730.1 GNAT family N-acetyltransferase [Weissella tructae]
MAKNYFKMHVKDDLFLVYPEMRMAPELFALIDSDRTHLRTFLDFVDDTMSPKDQVDYFKLKLDGVVKQTDALFFVAIEDTLIGCVDLHDIDLSTRQADIGYWIHSNYQRQGIISSVVQKLCEYGFLNLELNRLNLVIDTKNIASNKVALKNGFTFSGTQEDDILLYGTLRDMNYYYLLKRNFLNQI